MSPTPQQKPYFFDGRLHFPRHILEALVIAGLSPNTAAIASRGVNLDNSDILRQISHSATDYLQSHSPTDSIAVALRDDDFQFMLRGNDEVSV